MGAAAFLPAMLLWWGSSLEDPAERDTLAGRVVLGAARLIAPGPDLPADLQFGAANNNLDLALHQGRFYLGLRTAPNHFASDDARLVLLSSADRRSWVHELTVDLPERDLREPRFLSFGDRLLFYFFEAEDDPFGFAPIALNVVERRPDGSWTEPQQIFEPGHVPWRARVHGGKAWLTVYDGRRLYDDLGDAGGVRLLVSEDGLHWRSVSGPRSPIADRGASECDFVFDPEGNLVALARVEARGALVCTAPADRLERWDCTPTPHRHDSPLLVQSEGEVFALARRNVAGALDRGASWLPYPLELGWYQLRYWVTRKRTTLYRVIAEDRRIVPLLDLPSRGDTAFPAAVELSPRRFWVLNYSSDLEGPDLPWVLGQLRSTRIYGFEVELPEAHAALAP